MGNTDRGGARLTGKGGHGRLVCTFVPCKYVVLSFQTNYVCVIDVHLCQHVILAYSVERIGLVSLRVS